MSAEPLISVITPTYNRACFLSETINSVLDQNYSNVEHLIIDDGSTDNTRDVIRKFQKVGKVRYFYQNNCGQNIARNLGLKKARGEFICFLDSDDKFLPGKLSRSICAFNMHHEVDVVYGDYIFIDKNGNELNEKNMRRYSGNITEHLLRDNCVSMNTTMVRANSIRRAGGFSPNIRVADDFDLWLRMSVTSKFFYLPERLSAYRLMKNQISSNKEKRFESNETTLKNFFQTNTKLLSHAEQKDVLNFFYTRAARHFSSERKYKLAHHYFVKAFCQKLNSKRTIRALARHLFR